MRKFLILLSTIIILTITGCRFGIGFNFESNQDEQVFQPSLNVENLPNIPTTTELDIISAEYRTEWKEYSEIYDTPILISNHARLLVVLDNNPDMSSDSELFELFDEDFFEDNVIYAYIKSEASGSNQLTVDRAVFEDVGDSERENNKLILYMNRYTSEIGTADMAARVCLFGVTREDIEEVEEIVKVVSEAKRSIN